jgi:hypothetical protein
MNLQIYIDLKQYKGYNKMTKKRLELIRNIIYYSRYILFILHNFIVFQLLYIILRMKAFGIIYLILEIIYIIVIITQLLGAKLRYKREIIYNCMQIGFYIYLILFFIKIRTNYITPSLSFIFLRNNFIVLSILLVVIMIYSKIIVNKRQEKLN